MQHPHPPLSPSTRAALCVPGWCVQPLGWQRRPTLPRWPTTCARRRARCSTARCWSAWPRPQGWRQRRSHLLWWPRKQAARLATHTSRCGLPRTHTRVCAHVCVCVCGRMRGRVVRRGMDCRQGDFALPPCRSPCSLVLPACHLCPILTDLAAEPCSTPS